LAFAGSGKALIKGTAPESQISGDVTITEVDGGLSLLASLANVSPGKHGFHIHENGSCDDMGKAAGGHYNPDKVKHGMISKDGPMHAHGGDMGNIEIAQDGTGTLKSFLPGLTLNDGGEYDVLGLALILHEKEDDFSQPTGNAGGRIGCGIIELEETK
jgi:Cu-Zn family superoxide dismutase